VPSYARSVDCLTLKVTARFSETSCTIRPLPQRYLPRELESSTTIHVIILTPILCHILSIYNVLDIHTTFRDVALLRSQDNCCYDDIYSVVFFFNCY